MKFDKISMTNEDAQFLQTRQFQVLDICRLFRVRRTRSPTLAARPSATSQQSQGYTDDCLGPHTEQLQGLMGPSAAVQRRARALRDALRHTRPCCAATPCAATSPIRSGSTTGFSPANEVRAMENLNPIPGGDEYRIPLNTGNPLGSDSVGAPADQRQRQRQRRGQGMIPQERGWLNPIVRSLQFKALHLKHRGRNSSTFSGAANTESRKSRSSAPSSTLRFTHPTWSGGPRPRQGRSEGLVARQLREEPRGFVVAPLRRLAILKAVDFGADDNRLASSVQFLPDGYGKASQLADTVYRMAADGYLSASSRRVPPARLGFHRRQGPRRRRNLDAGH